MTFRVFAPGRVNLIGDHTDYLGGLVLPFAIQLGVTVEVDACEARIELLSDAEAGVLRLDLPIDPNDSVAEITPAWGRYVAGAAQAIGATTGIAGTISSTLPLGAGLSSSAALSVGVAAAFKAAAGQEWDRRELALAAQRGEQASTGVPCGIMDQLAIARGAAGAAVRIDCHDLTTRLVAVPEDATIRVIHSGQSRELATSEYARRRHECEAAERIVGPLRKATLDDLAPLAERADHDHDHDHDTLLRRARHVVTENARVDEVIDAFGRGDLEGAGDALWRGHRSLAEDFDTSTPLVDDLIAHLRATDGVYGARMTGAGFGGCVVALCRAGLDPTPDGLASWEVRPTDGVRLLD